MCWSASRGYDCQSEGQWFEPHQEGQTSSVIVQTRHSAKILVQSSLTAAPFEGESGLWCQEVLVNSRMLVHLIIPPTKF